LSRRSSLKLCGNLSTRPPHNDHSFGCQISADGAKYRHLPRIPAAAGPSMAPPQWANSLWICELVFQKGLDGPNQFSGSTTAKVIESATAERSPLLSINANSAKGSCWPGQNWRAYFCSSSSFFSSFGYHMYCSSCCCGTGLKNNALNQLPCKQIGTSPITAFSSPNLH